MYKEICEREVPSDILARYVQSSLAGPEALWFWRRSFATQLAASSLFCHLLACGDCTADRLVFSRTTGRVLACDLRPSYSPAGKLERPASSTVPFRLTRNVTVALSPFLVDGLLTSTMVALAQALDSQQRFVEPCLQLLLHEDLVAAHAAGTVRSDADIRAAEVQLRGCALENAASVLEKIRHLAPALEPADGNGPADAGARALVAQACAWENIATMPPTWAPWL